MFGQVNMLNTIFYTDISLIALSLYMILTRRNPIFSIFMFILTAIFSCGFLILMNAEFIALLILIIYTGVIAVLFLFTIIMYNLQQMKLVIPKFLRNPILWLIITYKIFWLTKFCCVINGGSMVLQTVLSSRAYTLDVFQLSFLFNKHSMFFLACGLLLFIAMVGSIVLTYSFMKKSNF